MKIYHNGNCDENFHEQERYHENKNVILTKDNKKKTAKCNNKKSHVSSFFSSETGMIHKLFRNVKT